MFITHVAFSVVTAFLWKSIRQLEKERKIFSSGDSFLLYCWIIDIEFPTTLFKRKENPYFGKFQKYNL